jgi:beta-fructofuranosidase
MNDNPQMIHFTAPKGWINDPYGITWHNGEYHVFFQYAPNQKEWAFDCHWGHATSPDLGKWTYQGIALTPDVNEGCWSGTIATKEGKSAAMLYTSVHREDWNSGRVRIARATDNSWAIWEKGEVVLQVPPELELTAFRDPYVFEDEVGYHLLMAAGFADGTAAVLVFDSHSENNQENFDRWVYGGVFASRNVSESDPISMGTIWECPQFIKVDDQWALIFSAMEPNKQLFEGYALGTLEAGRFTPRRWGRLTYGPGYYAGSAFNDKEGTPCMIHWIRGVKNSSETSVGALSITHTLVVEDGELTLRPYFSALAQPVSDLHCEITTAFSESTLTIERQGECWQLPVTQNSTEFVMSLAALEIFGSFGAFAIAR